jgi:hypothetical protein
VPVAPKIIGEEQYLICWICYPVFVKGVMRRYNHPDWRKYVHRPGRDRI